MDVTREILNYFIEDTISILLRNNFSQEEWKQHWWYLAGFMHYGQYKNEIDSDINLDIIQELNDMYIQFVRERRNQYV